jgi:hypothetical protein
MFNRIHQKLGTAGFIISIVALVAALGGGAYAASGGLSGKQKKEVEKIAKKYSGKPGAAGAAGPAGPTGPAGAAGAKGDAGAAGAAGVGTKGEKGEKGEAGTAGESVEVVETNPAACGAAGGVTYEVEATPTAVCSGEEGSPWTAGGTLPKGATETGAWAFSGASTSGEVYAPISFTIPLSAPLAAADVHYIVPGGQIPNVCTGSATSPTAAEGELCVYETEPTSGATLGGIFGLGNAEEGASSAGAFIYFEGATAAAQGIGSFAVTGG